MLLLNPNRGRNLGLDNGTSSFWSTFIFFFNSRRSIIESLFCSSEMIFSLLLFFFAWKLGLKYIKKTPCVFFVGANALAERDLLKITCSYRFFLFCVYFIPLEQHSNQFMLTLLFVSSVYVSRGINFMCIMKQGYDKSDINGFCPVT